MIAPGQPDDGHGLWYGRSRAGNVGTGLGYNAFQVQRSDAMTAGFGDIVKSGEKASIASTQIHFNMEGRDLLRVWDVNHYEEHITKGKQDDFKSKSMYNTPEYDVVRRGSQMGSIDLSSCVDCMPASSLDRRTISRSSARGRTCPRNALDAYFTLTAQGAQTPRARAFSRCCDAV